MALRADRARHQQRYASQGDWSKTVDVTTSAILQACIQRECEQRQRAEHKAKRERPEAAAPPRLLFSLRHRRISRRQRMLAFHHAAGDIIGHGLDDRRYLMGFGKHDAAVAGVLHKAVGALVASHQHMRHHIDPESRRFALADAALEQIDPLRHLREQGIKGFVEELEPGDFGVAQIDHDAGAVSRLDPRLVERIAQAKRTRFTRRIASNAWRLGHRPAYPSKLPISLAATRTGAKALYFQRLIPKTDGPHPAKPDEAVRPWAI